MLFDTPHPAAKPAWTAGADKCLEPEGSFSVPWGFFKKGAVAHIRQAENGQKGGIPDTPVTLGFPRDVAVFGDRCFPLLP